MTTLRTTPLRRRLGLLGLLAVLAGATILLAPAADHRDGPIFVNTAMRPPSMSTEPISCEPRPLIANAMRDPKTPRLPVVAWTMSFANSWTASRTSALR